jgi:hypothetical protein
MSDPLRIALVAEGPTDGVVIESALRAILESREFVLKQIFPEGSVVFGPLGAGWGGVYRWCHQSSQRGNGLLREDALVFQNFDLLILHLDADVAGYEYQDDGITPTASDRALPCEQECPPPNATTDALRGVLLSWCGEITVPAKTVMCTPSKSTEAWVVAALFPSDRAVEEGVECYRNPESRLGQQNVNNRIRKRKRDYEQRSKHLELAWPNMASPENLTEAYRFQQDFLASVPPQVID